MTVIAFVPLWKQTNERQENKHVLEVWIITHNYAINDFFQTTFSIISPLSLSYTNTCAHTCTNTQTHRWNKIWHKSDLHRNTVVCEILLGKTVTLRLYDSIKNTSTANMLFLYFIKVSHLPLEHTQGQSIKHMNSQIKEV